MRNAWGKISAEFRKYTLLNHIHCRYKFDEADSFDLKAYGMRNFMTVSIAILLKLNLVTPSDDQLRHVKFWEKHVQIASRLSRHLISMESTAQLQQDICELLLYFVEIDSDDFHITTNTHSMIHVVPLMKNDGVPRAFWAFVFEVVLILERIPSND